MTKETYVAYRNLYNKIVKLCKNGPIGLVGNPTALSRRGAPHALPPRNRIREPTGGAKHGGIYGAAQGGEND